MIRILLFFFLLGFYNVGLTTTIVPFKNMGEMGKAAPIIVVVKAVENFDYQDKETTYHRTRMEVEQAIKGQVPSSINVEKRASKKGDWNQIIYGEYEFEVGKTYLLYLNKWGAQYRTFSMSYGILEEIEEHGQKLFKPVDSDLNQVQLNPFDGNIEPFRLYEKDLFIEHLQSVVQGQEEWNSLGFSQDYSPERYASNSRMTPDHCRYLSGQTDPPAPRWQDFASQPVPVSTAEAGDSSYSTAAQLVQDAVGDINGSYSGVNLSNGGTHDYIPGCSGGEGAADGNFTSTAGSRSIRVIFNDPCGEIDDMSSTLALGGTYFFTSSSYMFNGEDWDPAAWGYVIVQNDLDDQVDLGGGQFRPALTNEQYTIMMTHELTHTLGQGHIPSPEPNVNIANMNPSCCNNITNLDIECLDFQYLEQVLPVQLIEFEGQLLEDRVMLKWTAASEIQNEGYRIERASENGPFIPIKTVTGSGSVEGLSSYEVTDFNPMLGINRYRLIQIDYNGTENIIGAEIQITYQKEGTFNIFPNPVTNKTLNLEFFGYEEYPLSIEIINPAGELVTATNWQIRNGRNAIQWNLDNLSAGVYILRMIENDEITSKKVVIY